MADKTYIYRPVGIGRSDIAPKVNVGASSLAVSSPSLAILLPVTIDEEYKSDLDAAMASLGYAYVGERTSGPLPNTVKNYGAMGAGPESPIPADGDVYYNTKLRRWYAYDSATDAWVAFGDFIGPSSVLADNLVAFLDSSGKTGKDSGIALASAAVAVKAGRFPLSAQFMDQTAPYITTSSATPTTIASIVFPGTSLCGTPTNIYAGVWRLAIANTGNIRIYDYTNGTVIAARTGITNTTETLLDLGPISNLPENPAIFRVQLYRSAGASVTVACSCLQFRF